MILLIDGDWVCFNISIALQEVNPFTDEISFDYDLAKSILEKRIKSFMVITKTEYPIVYFSCLRNHNWRRGVLDCYKRNREGTIPPIGLNALKTYCNALYTCIEEPRLEADDLISIDATGRFKDCNWIVSVDKDFLTIPTNIYNPMTGLKTRQSYLNSIRFLFYQIMIGDSADGYKGITGIGPVKATTFLNKYFKDASYLSPNEIQNIWNKIVELAELKGHDYDYILSQARVAHLLLDTEYNFKTKNITLWEASFE